MDVWRKEATDSEQILDTPRADLVHLLATLVAMLSVAERIPYASLNVETVDKSESSDQPPITSQGGLADILFQKVLEFMTRTDHIVTVRPGPGQPGGG